MNIEPATIAAIAEEAENVVAVKEASGNISQVAQIARLTKGKLDIYSGNDDQIASFSLLTSSISVNGARRDPTFIPMKFIAAFTGIGSDVVIDFSTPKVLDEILSFAVEKQIPTVLCTTAASHNYSCHTFTSLYLPLYVVSLYSLLLCV